MSEAPIALLPAQQRMLFLEELRPSSPRYVVPMAIRLEGEVEGDVLRRALAAVIARHEVLRTRVAATDDGPVARLGATPPIPLIVDASPPTDVPARAAARLRTESRRPFDLDGEGPLRAWVVRFAPGDHVLLLCVHHIAWDALSGEILQRDLTAAYRQLATKGEARLAPLAWQVKDAAAEQRVWLGSSEAAAERAWWRDRLAGAPRRVILAPERSGAGTGAGLRANVPLGASFTSRLRAKARELKVTTFALLAAAAAMLLGRLGHQERVVLGIPVSCRDDRTVALIGPFINTLAVPIDVGDGLAPADCIRGAQRELLEAMAHRLLPFEEVVRAVGDRHASADTPLFDVLCVHGVASDMSIAWGGIRATSLPIDAETAKANVAFHFLELTDDIDVSVEVSADCFRGATAERLGEQLRDVLEEIVGGRPLPRGGVRDRAPFDPPPSLPERIAAVAASHAARVALRAGEEIVTYGALERSIARLGGLLRQRGAGPGALVAVALPRGAASVIACLAAWRAGAAFMPVDPTGPQHRLGMMLEIADPVLILADAAASIPPTWCAHVVDPGEVAEPLDRQDAPLPAAPAYVLFTSGSTGRPKGVGISHAALGNRIAWMRDELPLSAGERVLHKSPLTFDVSLQEYLWPLSAGAECVILAPGLERDPESLVAAASAAGAVAFHVVPTMLRALLDSADVSHCASLRWLLCSGDVLAPELERRFLALSRAALVNLYGPTEAAIDVMSWHCNGDPDVPSVPIGRAIANVTVSIRFPRCSPVLAGAVGELCIGGAAVGDGYLRDPRATASAFVPDPDGAPGARMYRTGDIARLRSDGVIEFHGRRDRQIKVSGHRLELGEIEHALRGHPGVADAVAGLVDQGDERQVVAWFVPRTLVPPEGELLRFLAARLPGPAVPARLIPIDAVPLTPHGKVDHAACVAPPLAASPPAAPERASTGVRAVLSSVWREVFGREEIGLDDDFFAAGGDSLRALQTVARARRRGVRFPLSALVERPTIRRLAEVAIADADGRAEEPAARAEPGFVPLTPIQRWFFSLEYDRPDHWNLEASVTLRVAPRVRELRAAAAAVALDHDALRLRFERAADGYAQRLVDACDFAVDVVDAGADEPLDAPRLCAIVAELHQGLSLSAGPLAGVLLVRRDPPAKSHLVLVVHHLASDAVSMGILVEDIVESAFGAAGPRHAGSFAAHARATAADPAITAPPDPLSERAPLGIPVDRAYWQNPVGAAAHHRQQVGGDAARRLHGLRDGVRRLEVLVASLARAVCALGGDEVCLIDVELHGRDGGDLANVVGWFTRIVPIAIDAGASTLARSVLVGAAAALRSRREPTGRPEVLFNFLGGAMPAPSSRWIEAVTPSTLAPARSPRAGRSHLLEVDAWLAVDELVVRWTYGTMVHEHATIERLAGDLTRALDELLVAAERDEGPVVEAGVELSTGELGGLLARLGTQPGGEG